MLLALYPGGRRLPPPAPTAVSSRLNARATASCLRLHWLYCPTHAAI